jgi:hypothetical protein
VYLTLLILLSLSISTPAPAGKDMPQMLQCGWVKSRPVLEVVPFNPGDGIPRQAAQSAADDPDRDLQGSVLLSPEQAMQEMARAAAESAIRVAEGAPAPAFPSNPRVAVGERSMLSAEQGRRAAQSPELLLCGTAEGRGPQGIPPKSRFHTEQRKPLVRSLQPSGIPGPRNLGVGRAGGGQLTARDEPGFQRADLQLERLAREEVDGVGGFEVSQGIAAAGGSLLGHAEGVGANRGSEGSTGGSSGILGEFEILAAEPTPSHTRVHPC